MVKNVKIFTKIGKSGKQILGVADTSYAVQQFNESHQPSLDRPYNDPASPPRASSPVTPSLNVNISDDYHLYQRVDEYGRVIENDAILIPRSEAARFRINIARIKRANANNEGGEKSQRFGSKAMEDAENSGSNKKASRAVKTDAENKAAKTVQKKAQEAAESQERLTSTAAAKTFDKSTQTEKQADESLHVTSEKIFKAIDGANSNDDDESALCDRADRIKLNYSASELTHSLLNNSYYAWSDADEHKNADSGKVCHADHANTMESNDVVPAFFVESPISFSNNSVYAWSDADEHERKDGSNDSSVIDVHDHADVQLIPADKRTVPSVVNNYGNGSIHFHVFIPEVNAGNTSSRIECGDKSNSKIHLNIADTNEIYRIFNHN